MGSGEGGGRGNSSRSFELLEILSVNCPSRPLFVRRGRSSSSELNSSSSREEFLETLCGDVCLSGSLVFVRLSLIGSGDSGETRFWSRSVELREGLFLEIGFPLLLSARLGRISWSESSSVSSLEEVLGDICDVPRRSMFVRLILTGSGDGDGLGSLSRGAGRLGSWVIEALLGLLYTCIASSLLKCLDKRVRLYSTRAGSE